MCFQTTGSINISMVINKSRSFNKKEQVVISVKVAK